MRRHPRELPGWDYAMYLDLRAFDLLKREANEGGGSPYKDIG